MNTSRTCSGQLPRQAEHPNLGEILLNGGTNSKLDVTTELQVFGLAVTAEPYFAVTLPSNLVVMENAVRDYLIEQGIAGMNLSPAKGFGKSQPVATNGTAAGRQSNRLVELIVSGELTGTEIAPSGESR